MTFNEFSKQRANAIARTEITRASTEAEIQAYEQSNVVSGKEWFTALDERTCDECSSMNGKVI
jgi:SPP1 gp7 family putative phage head morphogenesis protein